eukprot:Ihof_evm2s518 gene=Ihof_evmTU2s518
MLRLRLSQAIPPAVERGKPVNIGLQVCTERTGVPLPGGAQGKSGHKTNGIIKATLLLDDLSPLPGAPILGLTPSIPSVNPSTGGVNFTFTIFSTCNKQHYAGSLVHNATCYHTIDRSICILFELEATILVLGNNNTLSSNMIGTPTTNGKSSSKLKASKSLANTKICMKNNVNSKKIKLSMITPTFWVNQTDRNGHDKRGSIGGMGSMDKIIFEIAGQRVICCERQQLIGESMTGFGHVAWDASFVLAKYLEYDKDLSGKLKGKTVVELGAGVGVPGVTSSILGAHVVLTDMEPAL